MPTPHPPPAGRATTVAGATTGRREATEDEARALASGIRLRILRLCLDRAMSNKEIAARLGANAASTLHHVRKLVATGFLTAQEERRGTRGAREVPYLATGKSWRLSVRDTPVDGGGQAMIDAFLDEISHIDVDDMHGADDSTVATDLTRLGLRLSQDRLRELRARIGELVQEYQALPPDMEDGTAFSLFVALYPDVTRDAVVTPRARRTA